jgi:transcriptional regulator with XRE-family HTH domain
MAEGRFKSRGLQALHDQFIGDDPERIASFEGAVADASIAQSIYDLRTEAGLSQRELAARVGTTASVICRLEDADYEGHSMAMLRRIAAAVGQCVQVRFFPASSPTHREKDGARWLVEITEEEKGWLAAWRAGANTVPSGRLMGVSEPEIGSGPAGQVRAPAREAGKTG